MGRKQVGKCPIRVNGSQRIVYLHEHIYTGKAARAIVILKIKRR